jgi:CHASE3 domain sensor protein
VTSPRSDRTLDDIHTPSPWAWIWSFVVAILILGAAGVVAVVQYTRFAAATATVDHINETIGAIDLVASRLVDAETSQRGYLLTNQREFLEALRRRAQDIARHRSSAATSVADDPSLRASADRLARSPTRRNRRWRVVTTFEAGDQTGAQNIIAEGTGKRLMDAIRSVVAPCARMRPRGSRAAPTTRSVARRAAAAFAIGSVLVALAWPPWRCPSGGASSGVRPHVKELSGRLAPSMPRSSPPSGCRNTIGSIARFSTARPTAFTCSIRRRDRARQSSPA